MIQKSIGSTMCFAGGAERVTPLVTVIPSNYYRAKVGDKMLRIEPCEISLQTMLEIIAWAVEK